MENGNAEHENLRFGIVFFFLSPALSEGEGDVGGLVMVEILSPTLSEGEGDVI